MSIRRTIWSTGFIGIPLIFLCAGLGRVPDVRAADKVTLSMSWVIGGDSSPFISGLEKGHYRRAGIEPTIQRGFGGSNTVKKVSVGAANFAFSDVGGMIVARSKGAKVKSVAQIYSKPPYVYFAFKGSGFKSPKDMEGRVLADSVGSTTRILFPALAAANGVDESKVKWLIVKPVLIFQSLLAGKVDFAAAYIVSKASLEVQARAKGQELVAIKFGDWGVDIYSNGVLTSDEMIAKKPDVVRRFVRAALESYAWSIENPDETISILLKHHPVLKREIVREHLRAAIELVITPTILEKGLGYTRENKMMATRDLLTKYMKLPVKVPLKDIYTLEFLPGIKVKAVR